jgi:hypothetical protein
MEKDKYIKHPSQGFSFLINGVSRELFPSMDYLRSSGLTPEDAREYLRMLMREAGPSCYLRHG